MILENDNTFIQKARAQIFFFRPFFANFDAHYGKLRVFEVKEFIFGK